MYFVIITQDLQISQDPAVLLQSMVDPMQMRCGSLEWGVWMVGTFVWMYSVLYYHTINFHHTCYRYLRICYWFIKFVYWHPILQERKGKGQLQQKLGPTHYKRQELVLPHKHIMETQSVVSRNPSKRTWHTTVQVITCDRWLAQKNLLERA